MTVDGFGAARWEKSAQSQGFGIFGPGRAGWGCGGGEGGGGWGVGEPRTGIIYGQYGCWRVPKALARNRVECVSLV